ncbi:transposase [Chloroflexota bacterium]
MIRRKWDPQVKANVVLSGFQGKSVADICDEYKISQAQYYQWRDQFIKKMPQIFTKSSRSHQTLSQENSTLKRVIGELTLELSKVKR